MERLTDRTEKGHAYLVNVKPDEQEVDSPYKNTLQCILDCFERLAAYEDTGLTPEQCAEYAQAEADGRLVVLPCKVGDKIYNSDGEELTVERIVITGHINIYAHTKKHNADGTYNPHWMGYEIKPKAFGKTAFLTRAEAEAALAAQGEHDG